MNYHKKLFTSILLKDLPSLIKILSPFNLEGRNRENSTPLMAACHQGWLPGVKTLIAAGANLEISYCTNTTMLMEAIQAGHLAIARYLIRQGANVNAQNNEGETALMYASTRPKAENLIKYLVQHGAHLETRSTRGNTALIWAACWDNELIITTLLELGANPYTKASDGTLFDKIISNKKFANAIREIRELQKALDEKNLLTNELDMSSTSMLPRTSKKKI